jgi:16S rRNA (adenine1518-N6/adenine1519-N6)-dimethyltransferase
VSSGRADSISTARAADGLPPLRDVIRRLGLTARKQLGQNFLLDLNLTGRIARAAGPLDECTVVEVGPGPGGLTRALLLAGAKRVVAVERDRRCHDALEEIAGHYPGRLDVIFDDALATDFEAHVSGPAKIIANLPYNIATPLLIGWIRGDRWPPWYRSITVMVQREVADRITASVGTKAYGRLSVFCQWRCDCRRLFDVDRRAFTPPPAVTSTVISLTPRGALGPPCSSATLERLTAAAFGQRRKMLRSSLKSLEVDVEALLDGSGIEPTQRAEEVDVEGFCRLAARIEQLAG